MPTVAITAYGEVQTHEEAIVYVKRIGHILDCESPRKHAQQCYRSERFAMKTGIPTNGSMVKNHISLKTGFGCCATR